MTACPVCNSPDTRMFVHRRDQPVHQNLVMRSAEAARAMPAGDVTMTVCESCGFVFNAAFDQGLMRYGPDYDNAQFCSGVFVDHLRSLADYLAEQHGLADRAVVEVGCGSGHFLHLLADRPGAQGTATGFDPSYRGPGTALGGRLRFERRLYDESCTQVPAEAVICRHVIEHVGDPVALLRTIRQALGDRPGTRVFFETPCVDWILENRVAWDFFYEHCSLFTARSLTTAFNRAGFAVTAARRVFGEQYLWVEAHPADDPPIRRDPGPTPRLAASFARHETARERAWQERLAALRATGPVGVWGAGAKGVTFTGMVDPDHTLIDCIVDLNPGKQGHYLPGTGHPIVDYPEIGRRGIASMILMNPNYRAENEALLARAGLDVQLVDWPLSREGTQAR